MIKLLIVDDEEEVRNGICTIIDWKANGIEVCGMAEDGLQALEMVNERKPDILLMDIRMPAMTGLQVVEAVYSSKSPVKSIMLSGYDDFSYAQQALKFGASDYLIKPCMPEEILETVLKIKAAIEQERAEKALIARHEIKFNQHVPFLKEKFLSKLMNDESKRPQEIFESLELYKINLKMLNVMVSILRIDDYSALYVKYSHKEMGQLRFAIKKILYDSFSSNFCGEVFEYREDIVLVATVDAIQTNHAFMELLVKAKQQIGDSLRSTVSFGVGRSYEDILEIHRSYGEAVRAVEARFLFGTDSIIRYDDIFNGNIEESHYPILEEKNIINGIKTGNIENLDSLVEEFFSALNADSYSKEHILKLCMALTLALYRVCVETNIPTDEIFGKGLSSIDDLLKVDTLHQIKDNILQITMRVSDKINSRKSKNKIIEQSLKFIEDHYHQDLTLDKVASSVFVNSRYFCLLFKQNMAINFIDYLHKVRIEKACQSLQDIRYKTYEVAFKVGYSNEKYFSQIFKKHMGMTPTQYRDSIV